MSALTSEVRKLIADGMTNASDLAKAISTKNVTFSRHQALRLIKQYNIEVLKLGSLPKADNKYKAESREEWFMRVQAYIEPAFQRAGFPLPAKVRVGCGFPGAGKKSSHLGEAWSSQASGDATYEIIINPRLSTEAGQSDWITEGHPMWLPGDLMVFGVVVHEYIHAALWHAGHDKHKHGADFKALAADLHLVVVNRAGGTTLTAKGQELYKAVLDEIGPYPMAPMVLALKPADTQTTRQLLLLDPDNSEFKVRMAREPIGQFGLPKSPRGKPMVIDTLSALRTEYSPEELISVGYAKRLKAGSARLEITDEGRERAHSIIEEIINGADIATQEGGDDDADEAEIINIMVRQR